MICKLCGSLPVFKATASGDLKCSGSCSASHFHIGYVVAHDKRFIERETVLLCCLLSQPNAWLAASALTLRRMRAE